MSKGKRIKIAHAILEMEASKLGVTSDKLEIQSLIESPTRYFYDIVFHKEEEKELLKNKWLLKTDVAKYMNKC